MYDPDSDTDSINEFIVKDSDTKALRTFRQPKTILEAADEDHDKDDSEESSVQDSFGSQGEGADSSEHDEEYIPVMSRADTRKSDRINGKPIKSYVGMTKSKSERSNEDQRKLKILKEEIGSVDFTKLVNKIENEDSELASLSERSTSSTSAALSREDDATRSVTAEEGKYNSISGSRCWRKRKLLLRVNTRRW